MKKILLFFWSFLILSMFAGCFSGGSDITQEEIVAAYEKAGYTVSFGSYEEKSPNGEIAYIQAMHSGGDYIYFAFFETEKEAQAYIKEADHPLTLWFFSTIYGDPAWIRMERCGNIVAQYEFPEFLEPFNALRKGK